MPVNYLNIRNQIIEMSAKAVPRQDDLNQRRKQAQELLALFSDRLEELRQRVELVESVLPKLRCALPTDEPLTLQTPNPQSSQPFVLLAADGSQINPSNHDPIQFGVINIGSIRMQPGAGMTPREETTTRLLYGDDLNSDEGRLTEDLLALQRDQQERGELERLACRETLPVVGLTDGPLELFGSFQERSDYQKLFIEYLHTLQEQAAHGRVIAGYVDRPMSDLLVRLLELMITPDAELSRLETSRPLRGVHDRDLFFDLLQPGERSALFAIHSTSARRYDGDLALHFFYLNVGLPEHPYLARVEIPLWVARDPEKMALLQTCLVEQCRQMGSRPFPYAIHRAHEIAVVHLDEKEKIQDMMIMELLKHDINVQGSSNKQYAKDQSLLRKRYS